jgi:predicted phage baseplate assembly protein
MSINAPHCLDERRRRIVRQRDRNGIDYLEVDEDQLTLLVYFLDEAPRGLTPANVRIDGGRRVTGIRVDDVRRIESGGPHLDAYLRITVDKAGDFTSYTLRLVKPDEDGRPGTEPLDGFDPRYASVAFSFKANCPSDLDCAPIDPCPPPLLTEPTISYLAKDYASFRQLILDRLALIMPGWTDRHVPDFGITMVEVLAYIGDYLSYHQDAVATEAYLDTARRRISVRRHVRLVDYPMHDGCNARAWVCLEVSAPLPLDARDVSFITNASAVLPVSTAALSQLALSEIDSTGYEVFEPVVPSGAGRYTFQLRPEHNAIPFWTWGDTECCLPTGAASATLRDEWVTAPAPDGGKRRNGRNGAKQTEQSAGSSSDAPSTRTRALNLKAGDVLIFEEVLGPNTGVPADADRRHRQAVRLTNVEPGVDDLCDQPVVEITWATEDALHFPLCLSAVDQECRFLEPISVARGNVILVDHGRSVPRCNEPPRVWPTPPGRLGPTPCDCVAVPGEPEVLPGNFAPVWPVEDGVITQRTPFPLPADIARRQAQGLAKLLDNALVWTRDKWRQTRDGAALSADDERALGRLFGTPALIESGFFSPADSERETAPGNQAKGLRWLLAEEKRLLAAKRRWLQTLLRRVASGSILTAEQLEDIAAVFGDEAALALNPASATVWGPASAALVQDPTEALPQIALATVADRTDPVDWWTPRRDLLGSSGRDRHFVGELDGDGLHLRFGDGDLGMMAPPEIDLGVWTRIGSGTVGNVGAEAIAHIVFCGLPQHAVQRVRNPLPATGGVEPEPLSEVKLYAPSAFRRRLRRAITAADYATLAGEVPGVQRAAATLRWTGGWYEAEVAIDPVGSQEASPTLLEAVEAALYRVRRIGHDLTVRAADYVPLDIALSVCVLPHVHRAHVKREILDLLSNRSLPDGRRGYFHPDNLTFGDDIALSTLVSLVHRVPGVSSVEVTKLERLYEGPARELAEGIVRLGPLAEGILRLGPLEVPRLDNDRGQPENGVLTIDVRGGR